MTFAAIISCVCMVVSVQVSRSVSFVSVFFSVVNSINLTWMKMLEGEKLNEITMVKIIYVM